MFTPLKEMSTKKKKKKKQQQTNKQKTTNNNNNNPNNYCIGPVLLEIVCTSVLSKYIFPLEIIVSMYLQFSTTKLVRDEKDALSVGGVVYMRPNQVE